MDQAADNETALVSLRPASKRGGLCLECGVHWLIWTVDGLRWAFREDGPSMLQFAVVQRAIGEALQLGSPTIQPEHIDWPRLIAQWELPWPNTWPLATDAGGGNRSTEKP